DLSPKIKDQIQPLICRNLRFQNRKLAPDIFAQVEPLDHPMARYRLAQRHEPTSRGNLYVTTYTHHFEGQTMEESAPLLRRLFDHVSQDKYKLAVAYQNDGDLVFWDNTAVLHRATPGGKYDGHDIRDMRRTTVRDGGQFGWGENERGTTWQAGLSVAPTKG
ncbi:hypothetical protein BJY00DRAFT_314599, partial [Aspergillus carlsbadensis]